MRCVVLCLLACGICRPAVAQLRLDPEGASGDRVQHIYPNSYAPTYGYGPPVNYAGPSNLRADDPGTRAMVGQEIGVSPSLSAGSGKVVQAVAREHRPLIHVKVRVVEVERSGSLAASSILEYIGGALVTPSQTSGAPLNRTPALDAGGAVIANRFNAFQRTSGLANFAVPGLISGATVGSGSLINVTSNHINLISSFLATELSGDVITAPQVTTLNEENVTFVAGSKVPFQYGNNVIQDSSNTIQAVFYKHVGTLVSVTPNIVGWDEARGGTPISQTPARDLSPITENDIDNWLALAQMLHAGKSRYSSGTIHLAGQPLSFFADIPALKGKEYEAFLGGTGLVTDAIKNGILTAINRVMGTLVEVAFTAPDDLRAETIDRDFWTLHAGGLIRPKQAYNPPVGCDWNPTDCTIDLDIVVRLSDAQNLVPTNLKTQDLTPAQVASLGSLSAETNVRAISNIVQVKSGNGVVMGGLISMRDDELISKIPVLGDIPYLGALFRSKENRRRKFETLIFVEAEVLPPLDVVGSQTSMVEEITSHDYCNARQHLQCEMCNTPMYRGMAAAGLAQGYLPPPTHGESEYWSHYHRAIRDNQLRKVITEVTDFR